MAKDLFHQVVKEALIKDGWNITHDPFPVDYGDVQMQIDLGAERLLAATKDKTIIAVEIKSFVRPSAISEFHTAVGQYISQLSTSITHSRTKSNLIFSSTKANLR